MRPTALNRHSCFVGVPTSKPRVCIGVINNNKGQSITLAKGDITLLSHLPGGSTRREVGPGGCIWPPILGEWRLQEVIDRTIRKNDGSFL